MIWSRIIVPIMIPRIIPPLVCGEGWHGICITIKPWISGWLHVHWRSPRTFNPRDVPRTLVQEELQDDQKNLLEQLPRTLLSLSFLFSDFSILLNHRAKIKEFALIWENIHKNWFHFNSTNNEINNPDSEDQIAISCSHYNTCNFWLVLPAINGRSIVQELSGKK